MRLKLKDFQDSCKVIKDAIDSKNVSLYTETLELIAEGTSLEMHVTNREYWCSVKFTLDSDTTFKAAVNAKLFIDLISKLTTEFVDITVDDTSVKIVANGTYKMPLIYNGDNLMELPKIEISNVTNTMNISTDILQSIATHNSKELMRGEAAKPVQKYYYVDNQGAITFTSGACVNNFTLEKDVKLLLSDKVVKLFKLFKTADSVSFTMGQDPLNEGIVQTKVQFSTPTVSLVAIMSDSSLISTVPVSAIRGMATQNYVYSAVVSKSEFVDTLDRLMLFNSGDRTYGKFEITSSGMTITDWSNNSTEIVQFKSDCDAITEPYNMSLNITNLERIVSGCEEEYLTICFGDHKAMVVKKANISDIIPELKCR